MSRKKPNVYYENKHNKQFPENKIKITERIGNYVYFQTKYGKCKKSIFDFNKSFDIRSAIDKTDFLKNKIIEKYGEKYDLSLVKYSPKQSDKIILICKKHGKFRSTKSNATRGVAGCMKCMTESVSLINSSNSDDFTKKAIIKHGTRYNYFKVKYKNVHSKVIITCREHGDFEQEANSHLQGQGCPKCGRIKLIRCNSKNPTGWTLTNWANAGKKSKQFDSFKVYIIKCWNNDEEFYKIGRTYKKTKYRFSGSTLPYEYMIIREKVGMAKDMYNLENDMKRKNKKNKYIPKIQFGGMHECFSQIDEI